MKRTDGRKCYCCGSDSARMLNTVTHMRGSINVCNQCLPKTTEGLVALRDRANHEARLREQGKNEYDVVVHYKAFPHAGLPEPMPCKAEGATVEEALEDVFRAFNHAHPGHTGEMAEKFKVRSLSVGDEVEIDGNRWVCAGMGWVNLSENPDVLEDDFMICMSREMRSAS